MVFAQKIGMELVKGLAVLALVFLSFGHQPLALPATGASDAVAVFAATGPSYCGQEADDTAGGYAPCHACRASVADLPPPPVGSELAYCGFVYVAQGAGDAPWGGDAGHTPGNPRAPPVLV